ncbi:MAG: DNA translocase FtsK 4TM domain-containing protein [Patescibacteria group bacterium]
MTKKRKKTIRFEKIKLDLDLNPDTSREIIAFIIGIVALFFILSFIGQLGIVGQVTKTLLQIAFGLIAYLIPVVLIYYGGSILVPHKFTIHTRQTISVIIILIAAPGLLSLVFPKNGITDAGGYIGYGLIFLCEKIIGQSGTLILVITLLLIAFLLFFNTSLSHTWQNIRSLFPRQKTSSFPTSNSGENKIQINSFRTQQEQIANENNEAENTTVPTKPTKTEIKIPTSSLATPEVKTDSEIDIDWQLPPLSLLEESKIEIQSGNIDQNIKIIESTLREFAIDIEMKDVNIGPTVTQYTFKPPTGVKLTKITSLQNDLALALAAHPIRVEAPIPGKALVGIEIPNKKPAPVRLKEILESPTYKEHKNIIPIPLGRNIAGLPVIDDLTKMPHLLIAGATGSGKSVLINVVLLNILMNYKPDQIKLILVDPKRVELSSYNHLPHLLTPVVTEAKNALAALKWGLSEMNERYKLLSEHKSRNIATYNQKNPQHKLPYIIIIIDELADLMMTSGNEIETTICRLAQMARATGIHLLIATQRPSVDVITGLIKANIATRIAFAVASQIDSRTILDGAGAEKLLGKGDMLYISRETGKPIRIQGVYASDQEIDSITQFWRNEGPPPDYLDQLFTNNQTEKSETVSANWPDVDDNLINEVVELVLSTQQASASYLQRKLKIGYARAARLIDILETKKIISPQIGNKPRQVLIKSLDELKQ